MTKKTTIDPEEIEKFEQHADSWWDLEGPLKTLHDINPTRLDFISNQVAIADKLVLDVGCGGGVLSEGLARLGAEVIGLDASKQAISVAKKHARSSNLKIKYVCEPLEAYEGGPFDVVTCLEMLEHVTDPKEVILHCKRLSKPGGLVFLSTINRTPKAYLTAIIGAEYVLGLLPRQTHDYNKFIKPSELANMLRSEGLEPLSIVGMDYHPFTRKATISKSLSVNYMLVCENHC